MKMSKNIPYILIAVAIFLLIFDFYNQGFILDAVAWKSVALSLLLLIVGFGLLYNIKRQK